jgi:hypothetical protein
LESVDLRTLQVVAPLASAQVGQALVLEQQLLAQPRLLEVAHKKGEALQQEAEGLATGFDAVSPTLSPQTLEDKRRRAWDALLRAPATSVVVDAAGPPAAVEVTP